MQQLRIGDPEPADLPAADQIIQRPRDFIDPQQGIGAVQQKAIEALHAQPLQRALHRLGEVVRSGVVVLDLPARAVLRSGHDVGLADQLDLLSQRRAQLQCRAKMRLALTSTIDIGVIETAQAALHTALDEAQQRLRLRQFGVLHQAHHAQQKRLFDDLVQVISRFVRG